MSTSTDVKKKQTSILNFFKPRSSESGCFSAGQSNGTPTPFKRKSLPFSRGQGDVVVAKRQVQRQSIKKATPQGLPLEIICLSSGDESDGDDEMINENSNQLSSQDNEKENGSQMEVDEDECDELETLKENSPLDLSEFLSVDIEQLDSHEENWLRPESLISTKEDISSSNDYKLLNFRNIIDFTLHDSSNLHLFNEEDWKIIERLTSLSVPAQKLFIRLYLRKHQWIRLARIKYPDVADDLDPLLEELVRSELIKPCDSINNLKEALELLDANELKTCARNLKAPMGSFSNTSSSAANYLNKGSLIECILKHSRSSQSIKSHFTGKEFTVEKVALNQVKKILGNTGYCVDSNACGLFSRMTYLYYPPQVNEDENGVSISHEFFNQLKVTNGDMAYPKYKICKMEIIYKSRQDLIEYERSCRMETQVLSAVEKKDHALVVNSLFPPVLEAFTTIFKNGTYQRDAQLPTFLRRQTAGHVWTRCLSHMTTSFEQARQYEQAVFILKQLVDQDTYSQSYKGKWYERLAIDIEKHLKDGKAAYQILTTALKDPHVKLYFRFNLLVRMKKMSKSMKLPAHFCEELDNMEKLKEVIIEADTLHKAIQGRRTIFTGHGGTSVMPVEEVALNYYKTREGFTRGCHSESMIYHALFNILLWEEIYTPIEDAFRTFHQTLPLDFVTEDFYRRRRDIVDRRLNAIRHMSDAQVEVEIEKTWNENFGTSCLISWDHLSVRTLKEVAYCMGSDTIAAIFERLCSNFRFNRSGLPDLLVWDPESKRVKAVEVKGPSDSLSGKQVLWLDFFRICGLDSEVCYVRPRSK